MNARKALEFLERVVEDRADTDPGIHEAVGVLSETVDRERELERALDERDMLLQAIHAGYLRSIDLTSWADRFEHERGGISTFTLWLRGVAEALGKIEQVHAALAGERKGDKDAGNQAENCGR